jgi:hypothetical protein
MNSISSRLFASADEYLEQQPGPTATEMLASTLSGIVCRDGELLLWSDEEQLIRDFRDAFGMLMREHCELLKTLSNMGLSQLPASEVRLRSRVLLNELVLNLASSSANREESYFALLRDAVLTDDPALVKQLASEFQGDGIVEIFSAITYGFLALSLHPRPTNLRRRETLRPDDAARTTAAFEAPFAGLQHLADDGTLNEDDEDFFRNTIQQIGLWRQRDGASPQVFELLIADLVKRLLSLLVDVGEMEQALRRFGADDETARDVAERVVAAINTMTELGGSDGVRDAELLTAITDQTDRIEDALRGLAPPPKKGLARKTGEAAVIAGGAAAGKFVADAGLHAVVHAFDDKWSAIRIGLMMGWRAVRELFVR